MFSNRSCRVRHTKKKNLRAKRGGLVFAVSRLVLVALGSGVGGRLRDGGRGGALRRYGIADGRHLRNRSARKSWRRCYCVACRIAGGVACCIAGRIANGVGVGYGVRATYWRSRRCGRICIRRSVRATAATCYAGDHNGAGAQPFSPCHQLVHFAASQKNSLVIRRRRHSMTPKHK